jgi:hypothetical protein
MISLVVLAGVFVVVLGWRSPATLGTVGAAVGALALGQSRPAFSVGGQKPDPYGGPNPPGAP